MAGLVIAGQTGVQSLQDGTATPPRLMRSGELAFSEVHGRFYEQAYRANLFSVGNLGNALSANSITLTATTIPILGVWNPLSSTANVVLLQCSLQTYINTLTTPAGAGVFQWASSAGNSAMSSTVKPFNRRTHNNQGAQSLAFSGSQALTGLTNTLTAVETIGEFTSPTAQTYGTIVAPTAGTSLTGFGGTWNIDGSIIVPPGVVWVIVNTNSTTTMTAFGRLMWEEVPL